MIGNPENLATTPNLFSKLPADMNFWERLRNTYFVGWLKYRNFKNLEILNALLRRLFGPDIPTINDMERDVAMIMVNSHSSIMGNVPTTPALIEIGGIQIRNDGPEISPVNDLHQK